MSEPDPRPDETGESPRGTDNGLRDRVAKLESYARTMGDLYFSADQKLAILDGLIAPDVTQIFDRSYGAHAHDALARALLFDVIGDIWAFVCDSDQRAPSLRNLWRMFANGELRDTLRTRFTTPVKGSWLDSDFPVERRAAFDERFQSRDRADREASWEAVVNRLAESVPKLLESEVAEKFDIVRKKAIAHYDMRTVDVGPPALFDVGSVGLKWGDPAKFMAEAEPILFDMILLATNSGYDLSGFKRRSRLYSADFWSRLQGKGAVRDLSE